MGKLLKIGAALALAAVPSAVEAQAETAVAAPTCIPKAEVRDATVIVVSYLVDSARNACAAKLPETAFLRTKAATDLAARLKAERRTREPSAAAAFRRMAGAENSRHMSDSTMVSGVGEMLAGKALDKADANRCDDLNGVLEAMSPMSGQQIGVLVTAFFSLADVGGGSNKSPKICPA